MLVRLPDGVSLNVVEVGAGFPLVVLHGGPGVDHSTFRPWLDPLGKGFRVLYVDQRGQGRSDRVDPKTLSLEGFARDVDLVCGALGLDAYALLGHSFGAIVTTWHAIELGTAAAYVVSGGGDSSAALLEDVGRALAELGDDGAEIVESWEREKSVTSAEEFAQLMKAQMPFHFAGAVPPGFGDETVYSPEVLRHFANVGYGDFDYVSDLDRVGRPTLVVVGAEDRTTTPRAARVLAEGIRDSELVVIPGAGHMSFVEAQDDYLAAVRAFLDRAVAG